MNTDQHRTISVPHLVFGIVFLGIAAVHWIGEATDADLPRTAIGFPVVLIGAGVVGLVAAVVNNRRRSNALRALYAEQAAAPEEHSDEDTEPTTVIEEKP
jgi:mannose/fructose/N-acetylgalactosamine-specific phosphotransferase system component IIC